MPTLTPQQFSDEWERASHGREHTLDNDARWVL